MVSYEIYLLQLQQQFDWTITGIKAWMSDWIPQFYMDVITYQFPNFDTGLDNLC